MELTIERKSHNFRLPIDLLDRLKKLAKKENRSLNNLVENALMEVAYSTPNAETRTAIADAKAGRLEGPLDVSSVEAMYKSMGL